MVILGLLFISISMLYASVGFGGGSLYLALMISWDVPWTVIPVIALTCNIIVVLGNSAHYISRGHLKWRLLLPPILGSIPMAYMAGRLELPPTLFLWILFGTLVVTGLRLAMKHKQYTDDASTYRDIPIWMGTTLGGVLGFIAGAVGVGGGIFLTPILYNVRAGSPRQIATTASIFIFVNSVAGLFGQLQKNKAAPEVFLEYWYLPILVLLGGQIGNLLNIKVLETRTVALITSLLVLFVACQIGYALIFK